MDEAGWADGRPEECREGEGVSEGCVEVTDDGFWKSFAMSGFASLVAEDIDTAGEGADELVAGVGTATDGRDKRAGLPFTWVSCLSASIEPNDLTTSDLMEGAVAGDDDMDAEISSIEPNVTAEPRGKSEQT